MHRTTMFGLVLKRRSHPAWVKRIGAGPALRLVAASDAALTASKKPWRAQMQLEFALSKLEFQLDQRCNPCRTFCCELGHRACRNLVFGRSV